MPQTKPFRIGYGILLAFLIIFVGTKISFIFRPLVVLVQTLFSPSSSPVCCITCSDRWSGSLKSGAWPGFIPSS